MEIMPRTTSGLDHKGELNTVTQLNAHYKLLPYFFIFILAGYWIP